MESQTISLNDAANKSVDARPMSEEDIRINILGVDGLTVIGDSEPDSSVASSYNSDSYNSDIEAEEDIFDFGDQPESGGKGPTGVKKHAPQPPKQQPPKPQPRKDKPKDTQPKSSSSSSSKSWFSLRKS